MKFQFTGTTEERHRQLGVGLHDLALAVMGTQFIASPGRIVTAVSRFQLQQSATGVGQVIGTGLLLERQAIARVLAIGFTQHGHGGKKQNPDTHVNEIGPITNPVWVPDIE